MSDTLTKAQLVSLLSDVGCPLCVADMNGTTLEQFLADDNATEWQYMSETAEPLSPHYVHEEESNGYYMVYYGLAPFIEREGEGFALSLSLERCWDGDWDIDYWAGPITTTQQWLDEGKAFYNDDDGEAGYLAWMAEHGKDPCGYFLGPFDREPHAWDRWSKAQQKAWQACAMGPMVACCECGEKGHAEHMRRDEQPAPMSDDSGPGCHFVTLYACPECADAVAEANEPPYAP